MKEKTDEMVACRLHLQKLFLSSAYMHLLLIFIFFIFMFWLVWNKYRSLQLGGFRLWSMEFDLLKLILVLEHVSRNIHPTIHSNVCKVTFFPNVIDPPFILHHVKK